MKIAITGATGFIGAAAASELILRGHTVIALTRPDSNLFRLRNLEKCEIVRCGSLADSKARALLVRLAPDAFVHCAWHGVGGTDRNASWQITENLRLTLDALELARAIGCRHWLSLGSQAEYGNLNHRIDEDSPVNPTTVYGRAKLLAGQAALSFCGAEGLAGTVLRVFSTYGPGDSPAWFIPYIIREFLAGRPPRVTACEQIWDYLYVADAGRAIALAIEQCAQGIFNLGSGQARPLRAMVEAIRRELQTDMQPVYGAIQYRPDQVMHLEADISRFSHATGWMPLVPPDVGLKNTIAFERAVSSPYSNIHA